MLYCLLLLFMALVAALDQIVKAIVSANLALGDVVPCVPGLFHFTNLRNPGAAFSILPGGRWLFAVICVAGLIVAIVLVKKKILTAPAELWCLAAIFGGGIGNLIDRVRLGYVVDMFEVEFMNFAVFNVADIFITCGAIVLFVYVLFFDREKEKSHDSAA